MRNGCLTRSARLAKNKHNATHTNVFFHDNLQLVACFVKVTNTKKKKPSKINKKNSLNYTNQRIVKLSPEVQIDSVQHIKSLYCLKVVWIYWLNIKKIQTVFEEQQSG